MLGATNPLDSAPGTIRGDFAIDVRYIDNILYICNKFMSNFFTILGRQEYLPRL